MAAKKKYEGERETLIQAHIMAVLNHRNSPCRLWRNNVGCLKDERGIPLHYGLGVGSSDWVGLVTREGKLRGRFLAVEVKTPVGRVSDEQKAWLGAVRSLGGLAYVLRSREEAEVVVRELEEMSK